MNLPDQHFAGPSFQLAYMLIQVSMCQACVCVWVCGYDVRVYVCVCVCVCVHVCLDAQKVRENKRKPARIRTSIGRTYGGAGTRERERERGPFVGYVQIGFNLGSCYCYIIQRCGAVAQRCRKLCTYKCANRWCAIKNLFNSFNFATLVFAFLVRSYEQHCNESSG